MKLRLSKVLMQRVLIGALCDPVPLFAFYDTKPLAVLYKGHS